MKNKNLFAIMIVLFAINPAFSEKWVGQAATYQMIDGSSTASGEIFERESLSAASNGFRIGADIKITNAANGRQITVKVNDRISNGSDYFVLLTPKAAKELGMEWETALVVVDAKFSDVNSDERLEIKGLVPEGEIDLENIKKFPDVVWPETNKTVAGISPEKYEGDIYPEEITKKDTPLKDGLVSRLSPDEGNFVMPKEKELIFPEEDSLRIPDKIKRTAMTGGFEDDVFKEKTAAVEKSADPEKLIVSLPEEKKTTPRISEDIDARKEPAIEKAEEKKEFTWRSDLEPGVYVRFSTTFSEDEGDRRASLFTKIFENVVGLKEKDRYILLIGPVHENDIDGTIKRVRSFGYRDAYVIQK